MALQVPVASNYDPATLYALNDVVLVGPTAACFFSITHSRPPQIYYTPDFTKGILYIAAPYGVTNASTVSIAIDQSGSDTIF